jgi:hypothetical protein
MRRKVSLTCFVCIRLVWENNVLTGYRVHIEVG